MTPQFPPDVLTIAGLDLLTALGWIGVYVRASRVARRISLVSAGLGVWFLGLGLALWHIHQFGDVAATRGIGDPAKMASEFANALITAAAATTGFFWVTLMSFIGMAIPVKAQKGAAAI